jgi:hypothetical protein
MGVSQKVPYATLPLLRRKYDILFQVADDDILAVRGTMDDYSFLFVIVFIIAVIIVIRLAYAISRDRCV